jgi:hypothetical protein
LGKAPDTITGPADEELMLTLLEEFIPRLLSEEKTLFAELLGKVGVDATLLDEESDPAELLVVGRSEPPQEAIKIVMDNIILSLKRDRTDRFGVALFTILFFIVFFQIIEESLIKRHKKNFSDR